MDTEWKKSDAELNRVYQESLKKLNPEQAALLEKAQRAWLTYRDAQCEADYKMFAGGTAAPPALTQCRVTLIQERTKTPKLRDLLHHNLHTVRTYLLKEDFQQYWEYKRTPVPACSWIPGAVKRCDPASSR